MALLHMMAMGCYDGCSVSRGVNMLTTREEAASATRGNGVGGHGAGVTAAGGEERHVDGLLMMCCVGECKCGCVAGEHLRFAVVLVCLVEVRYNTGTGGRQRGNIYTNFFRQAPFH